LFTFASHRPWQRDQNSVFALSVKRMINSSDDQLQNHPVFQITRSRAISRSPDYLAPVLPTFFFNLSPA
jgi:hypothetical protein